MSETTVSSIDQALEHDLRYPITVRAACAPSQTEVVNDQDQLVEAVRAALLVSPTGEVCLEGSP